MKFVCARGEGFVVTGYRVNRDKSILVSITAHVGDEAGSLYSAEDSIEMEVVVKLPSDATLPQIEKAARERASLILCEATTAILLPPTFESEELE